MDFIDEGTYQTYHSNGNLRFETYVNHLGDFNAVFLCRYPLGERGVFIDNCSGNL